MTADLRARIAEALRRHEPPTHVDPDGLPADEYDCCVDAAMAVLTEPTEYGIAGTDWAWGTRATDGPGLVIWPADDEKDARARAAAAEPGDGWRAVVLRSEHTALREAGDNET